jgi:ATP/maltotriose-dependent transcriptional regulator MalT/DNA-binding SARP family transcriptional activator
MPSIPISKTKIIPPRRREEILTRKRLLDLLFEALDKQLVLISAPAGYGKTSLLIDLVHHTEMPFCWLALDELDRDPQRFIAYFIASISERFPHFGGQSTSILSESTSLEQDMERVVVTLVNEIYDQIQEHFILALDDFHLVHDVEPVQSFINRFIQLADENCHLVISSRVLTALPDLSLMVARDRVSGLSFSELAFHADEIRALLEKNNNLRISDKEAQRLAEETEGWITGLQFSGSNFLNGSAQRLAPVTSIGLFDYLGQQVLDRQSPEVREFLLRTSLLDEFDASLCKAVLSPFYPEAQDWQGWINTIVQNNLFALPVGADGRWLRYHHLFRDFLRERFEREYPEEVGPILMRLGKEYEELGEWEKAHYVYKQLNDLDVLAGMIERSATPMLQHAMVTLETWMNELPPSFLRTRPAFISIRGAIVYMKGDLREGLNLLNQAEQAFRQQENTYELTLTLSRRATVYRFLGNYSASLNDAEEIIRLSETSDDLQPLYAEALRLKGVALYRLGQARQSVVFLERSLELYTRLNDSARIPVQLMETGLVYRALGYYSAAKDSYEKALRLWREEGNLTWQANLLNNLAVLHYLQGDYESAAQAFEEGLLCARRSNYSRMEALIAIGIGDLYAELEDFNVAEQNYQHAAEMVERMDDRYLFHSLALARGNLALLQKKPVDARNLLESVTASIRSGNSHFENGLLDSLYGRLHLLEGNTREAIQQLEQAEYHYAEDGRELEGAICRYWLAIAYHKNGDRTASIEKLKTVLAGRGQLAHAILVVAHQARELPVNFHSDPEVRRLAGDLFTRVGRLSTKMPNIRRQLRRQAQVIHVPAPYLTIQALGNVVVSIVGKPLSPSDWQTQSVRDLFIFFLNARKPMTKEQIGEALWPDKYEPAQLKLRFKNEMYRLRRAVGQETILFDGEFYSFNRNMDYEYDVDAFESYLSRARSSGNLDEQIEFYQKSVDLVRGPYLDDMDMDWAIPERERLNQIYLSALLSLADLLLQQSNTEKSLVISQRAIAYDPAYEPAYRKMMEIYHRRGDRAAVQRTYQACQDAMKKQLDMPPSVETEELYRSLT